MKGCFAFIGVVCVFFAAIIGLGSSIRTGQDRSQVVKEQLREPMPTNDEVAMFVWRFGAPTEDMDTNNETPRPSFRMRRLIYLPERVMVCYVWENDKWVCVGFTDCGKEALSSTEVIRRLASRDKGNGR